MSEVIELHAPRCWHCGLAIHRSEITGRWVHDVDGYLGCRASSFDGAAWDDTLGTRQAEPGGTLRKAIRRHK